MKEVSSIAQTQKDMKSDHYVQVYALTYANDLSTPFANTLRSDLPEDEQVRYDRIPTWSKRLEFVVSRIFLRHILGAILEQRPSQLRFRTTDYGKPELQHPTAMQPEIFFNLSHTEANMVLAVTRYGEVGIDIERVAAYQDRIARRFFHPDEYKWLQQLDSTQQASAFYRMWTIKEACVKALGYGLQFPLREIYTVPEKTGRCLDLWWQTLDLGPDNQCAIAFHQKGKVPSIIPTIAPTVYLSQTWLNAMENHS